MNIHQGPSAAGLQHMAGRAQEVRKQFSPIDTPAPSSTGNTVSETGNNLPAPTTTSKKPEHDTGIERAIAQLQLNAAKNPEAKGLQQALEKLQERLPTTPTIDTTV